MLLLHWWLDCQNDGGDKSFSKDKTKEGSIPGNCFFSYLNQVPIWRVDLI